MAVADDAASYRAVIGLVDRQGVKNRSGVENNYAETGLSETSDQLRKSGTTFAAGLCRIVNPGKR